MTMYSDTKAGRHERRPVQAFCYPDGAQFAPEMSAAEVGALSTLALAHVGDGVYELMMRTALAASGVTAAHDLHRETVSRVNAPAQARAAELAVYKRGRNAHVNTVPQHAQVGDYHAATGLEALFGWLWLQGKTDRLKALFALITEVL